MSEKEVIQTAQGFIDAFNRNDWDGCKALLTANSVYDEVGTSRRVEGVNDIVSSLQGWKEAMPDIKGTVTNSFASGNNANLEVTWQGTHTGPLQTPSGVIEATGKPQTTRSSFLMNIEGGKIGESKNYFDMLSFLQQLDVLQK
jgi:steroid delta-isomerase-like uncharacterized protein